MVQGRPALACVRAEGDDDNQHEVLVSDDMDLQMLITPETLVHEVNHLYHKITQLESLRPSETVNTLFSQLVGLCLHPCKPAMAIAKLDPQTQAMRAHLILLCGQAEGLLETHYSKLLGSFASPLCHLDLFPYYTNYRKLALLEYQLLSSSGSPAPRKLAFVGSGPLPLTSLVLALHHLQFTYFDNFDLDPQANRLAQELVSSDDDLSERMTFHTCNVKKLNENLAGYDVVFLAALVGLDRASKLEIIEHLGKYMQAGATLVVRSAYGARAFLYPIVDDDMLECSGFQVVSVFHPSDEVVNSIIVARVKNRRNSSNEEAENQR